MSGCVRPRGVTAFASATDGCTITILGYVRGDRATQLVVVESLVLVGECVSSVSTQVFGQIAVGLSRTQEFKGLSIVVTDIPNDMIEHYRCVFAEHSPASSSLESGCRSIIIENPLSLSGPNWREVRDGVPERDHSASPWPPKFPALDTDYEEACAFLRDSVLRGQQDSRM